MAKHRFLGMRPSRKPPLQLLQMSILGVLEVGIGRESSGRGMCVRSNSLCNRRSLLRAMQTLYGHRWKRLDKKR